MTSRPAAERLRIVALADLDDGLGFRLAGVETRQPASARELERHLAQLTTAGDVGLILVSARVADLAPPAVESAAGRPGTATVLILPPASGGTGMERA